MLRFYGREHNRQEMEKPRNITFLKVCKLSRFIDDQVFSVTENLNPILTHSILKLGKI